MQKRIILIILGVILLALVITGIVVLVKNNETKKEPLGSISIPFPKEFEETSLNKYIQSLGNEYYLKYSGTYKNSQGKDVKAVIEYTKKGEDFAIKASELDLFVICKDGVLNTISSRYKLIIEMPEKNFDAFKYNLLSEVGQTYIRHYATKENNTTYYVEEYTYKESTIKYFFLEDVVRYIMLDDQKIDIVRVEKIVNTDLFTIPEGYSKAIT